MLESKTLFRAEPEHTLEPKTLFRAEPEPRIESRKMVKVQVGIGSNIEFNRSISFFNSTYCIKYHFSYLMFESDLIIISVPKS